MIKNIIFDIGNVLLRFNPKEYFSDIYKNEKIGIIMCDLIMNRQVWKDYDLGIADLNDVKMDFTKKEPNFKDEIIDALDHWQCILKPISYTFQKMEELKKAGYRIYLLSNLGEDAYIYIDKHFKLFDIVDGYVVSFKEHIAKPDFAIYECLMNRYNLKKEECLFLDDTYVNVKSSIAFGMPAIHFMNEEQVEKELKMFLKGN